MVDNSLGDAEYYDSKDYAGFATRLLVMVIDAFVLLLVAILLWMPFAAFLMFGSHDSDPSGYFCLIFLIATWIYLAPVKRSNFGTIGFRILGVKLVSAKGGCPSLFNMTIRMLMWMFGPFNIVLDLLWLGADTESQSLRDCYLGTYLIKRNAKPIGRAPLRLTHYNAMGFTLAYPRVCRPRVAAMEPPLGEAMNDSQLPELRLFPYEYGWHANLDESLRLFDHRVNLEIQTRLIPTKPAVLTPVSKTQAELVRKIIPDLSSLLSRVETELRNYNSSDPEFLTEFNDPRIWLNCETDDGASWTVVVGRKDWPDFGYHAEFNGTEFVELWAGD